MPVELSEVRFCGGTLEDFAADVRKTHAEEVAVEERKLAELKAQLPERIASLWQVAAAVRALQGQGFECHPYAYNSFVFHVKATDLPRVGKAVGRLKKSGHWLASKWDLPEGTTGDHVVIALKSERYPVLLVVYTRPLTPESKCQVVNETKTERKLVCSI